MPAPSTEVFGPDDFDGIPESRTLLKGQLPIGSFIGTLIAFLSVFAILGYTFWYSRAKCPGANLAVRRFLTNCNNIFAYTLVFIFMYNMAKVPFYFSRNPATHANPCLEEDFKAGNCDRWPSWGMETGVPLNWMFGFRARKMFTDPMLWLTPHTMMGNWLIFMWFWFLLGKVSLRQMSGPFFLMGLVFAIHMIPSTPGVPNRLLGCSRVDDSAYVRAGGFCNEGTLPLTEIATTVMLIASAYGVHLRYFSEDTPSNMRKIWHCWAWSSTMVFLAPLLELLGTATGVWFGFADGSFLEVVAEDGTRHAIEGPHPSPESGYGFWSGGCDCPVASMLIGTLATVLSTIVTAVYVMRPDGHDERPMKPSPYPARGKSSNVGDIVPEVDLSAGGSFAKSLPSATATAVEMSVATAAEGSIGQL